MRDFDFAVIRQVLRRYEPLSRSHVFINLDTVCFEGGEEIIELLSGVVFSRECSIYFVSEQISTFLTDGDEAANLIVFFLGHEHEDFSPSSHCPNQAEPSTKSQRHTRYRAGSRRMTEKTMK